MTDVLYQHLQPCYSTLLPKRYAKQVFGTTEVRRPLSSNASGFVNPILEVQDVAWLGDSSPSVDEFFLLVRLL